MLKGLKIALMLGVMFIASALHPIQAKAQEKKDSTETVVIKPIFSGEEKNLPDTLLAYAVAANSAEAKSVFKDAADQITAGPKENTFSGWYNYVAGLVLLGFGLYQMFKKKQIETKLKSVQKE